MDWVAWPLRKHTEKIGMAPAQEKREDWHTPCASIQRRLAWPLRKQKQNGRRRGAFSHSHHKLQQRHCLALIRL